MAITLKKAIKELCKGGILKRDALKLCTPINLNDIHRVVRIKSDGFYFICLLNTDILTPHLSEVIFKIIVDIEPAVALGLHEAQGELEVLTFIDALNEAASDSPESIDFFARKKIECLFKIGKIKIEDLEMNHA